MARRTPRRFRAPAHLLAASVLPALLLAGCDSSSDPGPQATTISVSPASFSFDAVGDTRALAVEVLDQNGDPMPDVTVAFNSSNPQVAQVSGAGVVTSTGNGTAQIQVTAGTAVGSAVAEVAQVATSLELIDGDGQAGTVGQALAQALLVLARDRLEQPAADVGVQFTVEAGDGSVSPSPATTDGEGRASATWTLGTVAGEPQRVRAALAQNASISLELEATAAAGPAALIEKLEGDQQTAPRLSELPELLVVRVMDAFGNHLAGESVTFAVASGGGALEPASATTDADGLASTQWTLGEPLGEQTISVTVAALEAVSFSATAVAEPAEITAEAGDGQTAGVTEPVPVAPSVRVLDAGGLPVPGLEVRFEVTSGGGTVEGPEPEGQGSPGAHASAASSVVVPTDDGGIATVGRWILGTQAGTQTLDAVVGDLQPFTFTATAEPGAAHTVEKAGGDAQTGAPGQLLPQPLVARVTDEHGNPVPGEAVSFEPDEGSGSVNPPVRDTDAAGLAPVEWTLGPDEGSHGVTASIEAGSSVAFAATAEAGAGGEGAFNVELQFLTEPSDPHREAFEAAAARWESIIVGDLVPIQMNADAGQCGSNSPAIDRVVDDLLILVTLEFIDGPGGVLGSAGPCFVRVQGGLPVLGRVRLDTADLDQLEAQGRLVDVIVHEIGHVLGFGTLWSSNHFAFLQNPSLPDDQGADTHFNGGQAIGAFDGVGGTAYTDGDKVPVENTQGGQGSRDAHWRKSVFDNELLTFSLSGGQSPLSIVTVASLLDMGYQVDFSQADGFSLDFGLRAPVAGPVIHFGDDIYRGPIHMVDESGRTVGVLRR